MLDIIQDDLRAWITTGDRARGGRAIDALANEWRPRVRNFLRAPSEVEVEEALSDALSTLCVAPRGGRPRALAPDDAESPAAWRRRVLRNHLIDKLRRRDRRRHAERGEALGLSPAAEADAWRTDRAALAQQKQAPPEASGDAADDAELKLMRHQVVRALPELPIRYRVVMMLALGMDPSPFVSELADALREDEAPVQGRVAEALRAGHDGGSEHLSLPMIRVLWPREAEAQARESARKALERARNRLRAILRVKS